MELKEMIKVMQHFADGGEVEVRLKVNNSYLWSETKTPCWNWIEFSYRIKEQKQKVTIEKWLCKDKKDNYVVIETSSIEFYVMYEKIKLLETYEVEI